MLAIRIFLLTVLFAVSACNNNEIANRSENISINNTSEEEINKIDTIKELDVDDYPVTNEMLKDIGNSSSYKMKSGKLYSYDRVWYSNDTLGQILIFELHTDYLRAVTYHFYSNNIPTDLIKRMTLNIEGGELASQQQKLIDLSGFLKQATVINSSYFITKKGFKLGDTEQKAIDYYGRPDKRSVIDGSEMLEWEFIGDELYDGKEEPNGKLVARDSNGHHIIMYFINKKLVGLILSNYVL